MIQREPEASGNTEQKETAATNDVEALQKALEEEKKRADGCLASWQRVQADFINYKRRIEQDREELTKFANANLILYLLPLLDDMERAFDAVPPELAREGWLEGMMIVARKFRTILESQGLAEVKAVGQPFDTSFHEAMGQEKGKEGIVTRELEKGYTLHGKLLRPARVLVGSGEEEKKED